jgi:hypothetical protein
MSFVQSAHRRNEAQRLAAARGLAAGSLHFGDGGNALQWLSQFTIGLLEMGGACLHKLLKKLKSRSLVGLKASP